ncbi:hypothetical protein Tco_0712625 [Tanacetum coccineum]
MVESAKRHEENSIIIKEIQASTDAAIRNQGALYKTLEIQIGQMSKVLQERGIGSLPGSTEPNVKSISTAKVDSSMIRRIESGPYAISDTQYSSLPTKTVSFPNRLHGYCCHDWKEAREVKILEASDHTLPQKEKDPGRFTLPCFIYNVCFDKALVDLGASVSVCPFSYHANTLSEEDTAYQRLDFTRKRVFSLPNMAYPCFLIRYQLIRRIHQLDMSYQPFYSEQCIDLCSLNNVSVSPNNTAYSVTSIRRQFLKELRKNTFSCSEHEDANEHIEKVLEIVDLFHIPKLMQDQVMLQAFLMSLTGAASRWLRNEPSGSITNWETLKTKFLNKSDANYAHAYITQRTVHLKKKGKLLKRLTTHSLEHPINLEDSIEQQGQDSTNRHEENSNIIKEIRASIDAAIRNQGALIKTLEIQIDQMSKVLQERGIKGLPGSTEPNPKDHVKSISTAKADSSVIFRIGSGPYVVSDSQYSSLSFETVPFPSRLHGYCCDDWKEACKFKILETYDHALPQKERDLRSFIYRILFIIFVLIKPLLA